MARELQIPILGIDIEPRETSDGHTISFLVIDLDERTVAIVQEVPRISTLFPQEEQHVIRFGSPRLDHEMMTHFLQYPAQNILARICDGCTVDVEHGHLVIDMNDDAGEACTELEELVNMLTY